MIYGFKIHAGEMRQVQERAGHIRKGCECREVPCLRRNPREAHRRKGGHSHRERHRGLR